MATKKVTKKSRSNKLRSIDLISFADTLIVLVSVVLALVTILLAFQLDGVWKDYLINLSAGSLTVAITVVLVDKLRETKVRKRYKIPQDRVLNQILNLNAIILLVLSALRHKENIELVRNISKSVVLKSSNEAEALALEYETVKTLSGYEIDTLLANSNPATIRSIKQSTESINKSVERLTNSYDFSFDLDFGTKIGKFSDSLSRLKDSFVVLDIGQDTLNSLFKDTRKGNKTKTPQDIVFISSALKSYLEELAKLYKLYL